MFTSRLRLLLAATFSGFSKTEEKRRQRQSGSRSMYVAEPLEWRTLLSTYTVTNLSDSSAGSLRSEIAAAEAHAGADTINFGGLTGTITLTTGELSINSDITITGPGAKVLAISGNNASSIFDIVTGTVSISALTIRDGKAVSGGGIYNVGTLTVTNCTFSANSASANGFLNNGGAIDNIGGALTVTKSNFDGNAASSNGGAIDNFGGILTVTNSNFSANSSFDGGGIINDLAGTLAVTNSTFSGNSSVDGGGAIFTHGTMTATNSTFSGNSSVHGGGIDNIESTVSITSCTFSGNSGGGIDNDGTLSITNSTLSGNSASGSGGGGIYNFSALTVTNCTFSGNSATAGGGGGILNSGGTVYLGNTIIAGNTASIGPDVSGSVVSHGHNLISKTDGSTGWNSTGPTADLTGTIASPLNAKLGPLGTYGGPTQTLPLLIGSPALNAGDNSLITSLLFGSPATDQLGKPRIAGSKVDIGAFEGAYSFHSPLVVSTLTDVNDGNFSAGKLSLREAILIANNIGGRNTITFLRGLTGTITLTTGELVINSNITITGPGSKVLAISGNNATRIFEISRGKVSISGLTIKNAKSSSNGGGIYIDKGTVIVTNCTFSANSASGSDGGGAIDNESTSTLTITNCTFSRNSSSEDGGGILNNAGTLSVISSTFSGNSSSDVGGAIDNESTLIITNSTFSGNSSPRGGGIFIDVDGTSTITNSTFSGNSSASSEGGGIDNYFGTLTVTNSTFSGNSGGGIDNFGTLTITNSTLSGNTDTTSGGGIYNYPGDDQGGIAGALNMGNTIVAGNTAPAGPDVSGNVVSKGHNLIGKTDGSTGWKTSDRRGTVASPLVAKLAALANNGGPTKTMALLAGSPAINAGNNALIISPPFANPPIDQRGKARIAGIRVDIGAFEVQPGT